MDPNFLSKFQHVGHVPHPVENVLNARLRETNTRVCLIQDMTVEAVTLQRHLCRRLWSNMSKDLALGLIEHSENMVATEYFQYDLYTWVHMKYQEFESLELPYDHWFTFIKTDVAQLIRALMRFCCLSFPIFHHGNISNGVVISHGWHGIDIKLYNLMRDGNYVKDLDDIVKTLMVIICKLPLEHLDDLSKVDLFMEFPTFVPDIWKEFIKRVLAYRPNLNLPGFYFEDPFFWNYEEGYRFMSKICNNFNNSCGGGLVKQCAIFQNHLEPLTDNDLQSVSCPILKRVYLRNKDMYLGGKGQVHILWKNTLTYYKNHAEILTMELQKRAPELLCKKELTDLEVHFLFDKEHDVVQRCFSAVRRAIDSDALTLNERLEFVRRLEFREGYEDDVNRFQISL